MCDDSYSAKGKDLKLSRLQVFFCFCKLVHERIDFRPRGHNAYVMAKGTELSMLVLLHLAQASTLRALRLYPRHSPPWPNEQAVRHSLFLVGDELDGEDSPNSTPCYEVVLDVFL